MCPICVRCSIEMTCSKNGFLVEIPDSQQIRADRWECPRCHYAIVTGFAREPYIEQWRDTAAWGQRWAADLVLVQ